MNLTDRLIKTAKATGKDEFLNDGAGLYLRVAPTGAKTWLYRYKKDNKITKWVDLGQYPAKSLSVARVEAASIKQLRREGIDPIDERNRLEALRQSAIEKESAEAAAIQARATVHAFFERWMRTEITPKRKDQGAEVRRFFEKDVLPQLGSMPVEDVQKRHIFQIIEAIKLRGGNGRMASQGLANLRQMFRYAVETDILKFDPTASIRKDRLHQANERERVLSAEEIQLLVRKLPAAKIGQQGELALFAVLSTCCRIGELLKTELTDIDFNSRTWRIPALNSKNGKEHRVFLSDFALNLFTVLAKRAGDLGSKWLFPATNKDGHLYEKSLSKQVGDRQRPGLPPMTGRTKLVDALVLPNGHWTPHDLRRTGATIMGELGISSDVIERCLNHTEQNKMKRIYQRQSYANEMMDAWSRLGAQLEELVTPQQK